jgi:hypothetical protein
MTHHPHHHHHHPTWRYHQPATDAALEVPEINAQPTATPESRVAKATERFRSLFTSIHLPLIKQEAEEEQATETVASNDEQTNDGDGFDESTEATTATATAALFSCACASTLCSRCPRPSYSKEACSSVILGIIFFLLLGALGFAIALTQGVILVNTQDNGTPKVSIVVQNLDDDPAVQQLQEWRAGNQSEQDDTAGLAEPVSGIPDYLGGYRPTPTPQLAGVGPLSGIPAAFTVNTTGMWLPQGWGANWHSVVSSASRPAEIAIVGDAVIWYKSYTATALFNTMIANGFSDGGSGWMSFGNMNCSYIQNSGAAYDFTRGGPGAVAYGFTASSGSEAATCFSLRGNTIRLDFMVCPSCGSYEVLLNGAIAASGSSTTSDGTTYVSSTTFASSAQINSVQVVATSGTFWAYGLKATFQGVGGGGIVINQYANLYDANSVPLGGTGPREQGPSTSQWMTCTCNASGVVVNTTMSSPLHVDGDLVVNIFVTGDDWDGYNSGQYVANVLKLVTGLHQTYVSRDVLWILPVYDGAHFRTYGAAIKSSMPSLPEMAFLDMNTWWDYSTDLLCACGALWPCGPGNLPLEGSYCWDNCDQVSMSSIGGQVYATQLLPFLNGQGFYANSGTWPRPNTSQPWPVPIPQAYLNRPRLSSLPLLKKGVSVLPEGTHPILYNCQMITSLNVSWYYNWDIVEKCAQEHQQNVTSGIAKITDFPMYMPLIWNELFIAFARNLYEPNLPDIEVSPILLIFNEVDLNQECFMSPMRTALLWPLFEATGRLLSRPVTSQNNNAAQTWSPAWKQACLLVLGRPCQYDLGTQHDYAGASGPADNLNYEEIDEVLLDENIQPILLTEFGPTISTAFSTTWITSGSLTVLEQDPTLFGYAWYAIRTFCNAGWNVQSLYPCVNNQDATIYYAGTGDSAALTQPLSTLSLTTVGQAYAQQASTVPIPVAMPSILRFKSSTGYWFQDTFGNNWFSDTNYTLGGATYMLYGTSSTSLYPGMRVTSPGFTSWNYTLYVMPGQTYSVHMFFIEQQANQAGQRVFNVAINGVVVLPSFDIYVAAGGGGIGTIQVISPVSVGTSGLMVITFTDITNQGGIAALLICPSSNAACNSQYAATT